MNPVKNEISTFVFIMWTMGEGRIISIQKLHWKDSVTFTKETMILTRCVLWSLK